MKRLFIYKGQKIIDIRRGARVMLLNNSGMCEQFKYSVLFIHVTGREKSKGEE